MINNKITILMIVSNECVYAQLALKGISLFANQEMISIIVADNGSTDDTPSYMANRTDIHYVRVAEEPLPAGRVINDILNRFPLLGDLMVLDCSCMLTPGCIENLSSAMYEQENIAIAGAMCNSARNKYQRNLQYADYEDAVKNVHLLPKVVRPSLAVETGAVLFKNQTIRELGLFDTQCMDLQHVFTDYCLRSILAGKHIRVCESAFVWDVKINRVEASTDECDDMELERKWGMRYFNMVSNEYLINQIERSPSDEFRVLEVGCDCGATLLEIKNRYPNAQVYGSELNENAVRIASCVAKVCVNNIEEHNLPFDSVKFDYIIFGDVLEHLRDPLETVRYCRGLLNPGGYIIASIPNIMHISVIEELLNGNFTYTETGLLDKTHIHFFTGKEILKMFQAAQYEIEHIASIECSVTESQNALLAQLCSMNLNSERYMFETFQYLVKAKKIEEM